MRILQLETGLFPDAEAVRQAIDVLKEGSHEVSRVDLTAVAAEDDGTWDAVVQKIMAADKVATV